MLNNYYCAFRSYKTVVPARKQARLDSNRMEIDEPEFNILKGILCIFNKFSIIIINSLVFFNLFKY